MHCILNPRTSVADRPSSPWFVWLAGVNIAGVFYIHLAIHPALLLLFIWFGKQASNLVREEQRQKARQLTPEQIASMLIRLGSHPELAAAGWFPDRWKTLTSDDRLSWVTTHLDELQDLWCSGNGEGFEAKGTDLPMFLAVIDDWKDKQ